MKIVGSRIETKMAIELFPYLPAYTACGRQPSLTLFVQTSYAEVVGSQVDTKMAIEFFPYTLIQRM